MGVEAFTWQKIAPLGAMFFCILFNYTILRDTKVRKGSDLHNPMTFTLLSRSRQLGQSWS